MVGGLLEAICWWEKLSTEWDGISESEQFGANATQTQEGRRFTVACGTAVWWPVWQQLWLTGPGDGDGKWCPWHPGLGIS
jgi:hypothetical protein